MGNREAASKFWSGGFGRSEKGPFGVEVASAKKYGFLDIPETEKIRPTELRRRVLRPKSPEDEVKA